MSGNFPWIHIPESEIPEGNVFTGEEYTSSGWFEREQRQIFGRTWQFAGFVEDLKNSGDYVSVQAGPNNIFVIKGGDGKLRAFHNICRHRGTQLLRHFGNSKDLIVCPYHDWTYNLKGELVGIPLRQKEFSGVDMKERCLFKAQAAVWRSMIFVHPDPAAPGIDKWFEGVEPYLGPHRPEDLLEYGDASTTYEIKANWKIVAENYMDTYHLAHLHADTLRMYDHGRAQTGFAGPHFMFYEPLAPEYKENLKSSAPFPLIDMPEDKLGAYVPLLFPNLGLSETECEWSTFHIKPLAPDLTEVHTRTRLAKMSGWDYLSQGISSRFFSPRDKRKGKGRDPGSKEDPLSSGDFMKEDIYACEQQQKSLGSPHFRMGPSAKNLERPVRIFQTIVKRLVNGE